LILVLVFVRDTSRWQSSVTIAVATNAASVVRDIGSPEFEAQLRKAAAIPANNFLKVRAFVWRNTSLVRIEFVAMEKAFADAATQSSIAILKQSSNNAAWQVEAMDIIPAAKPKHPLLRLFR
jgi:hypothetical protein